MAIGVSIHLGLNNINQDNYDRLNLGIGRFEALASCNNDATAMRVISKKMNYDLGKGDQNLLLDDKASVDSFKERILFAQEKFEKHDGGTLLVTFSGHGILLKNVDQGQGERYDEAWCLWDRPLLDDELFVLFAGFKENVRVIVVTDSCHSGTSAGQPAPAANAIITNELGGVEEPQASSLERKKSAGIAAVGAESKLLSVREEAKRGLRQLYELKKDDISRSSVCKSPYDVMDTTILHLSACQNWQETLSGPDTGFSKFTKAFLEVLCGGISLTEKGVGDLEKIIEKVRRLDLNKLTYMKFHQSIWEKLKMTQSPNFSFYGRPNYYFINERTFTIHKFSLKKISTAA